MKPSKPTADQIDAARRAGPWDTQIGWKPDQAMIDRAAASRPFWAGWDQELIESIQQLYDALHLRCGGAMGGVFDPQRVRRHASENMSPQDQEIYERFLFWLEEMRQHKLSPHVTWIGSVIVQDGPCKDRETFKRAVELHVALRRGSHTKRIA
jgi:hypothetical protein